MTDLADGTYNYTIWTENLTGEWEQSAQRFVTIDTEAPYSLYACQDLTIENGSYILAQNVSSAGTCFTISANNITLDGAGYTINYSQSATGYAINNTEGYNFTKIKNANILKDSSASSTFAIYFQNASNGLIDNNTITILDSNINYGIGLYSSSNSNTISNNTMTTSGFSGDAILIYSGSNSNTISNNTIIASGSIGYGVNVYESTTNTFSNNIVTTSGFGGRGIYLSSSSDTNNIANNTITTSGDYSYGIIIQTFSNSNTFSNNTITTSGSEGYGFYLDSSNDSSIANNTITTSGSGGYGIYLYYSRNSSINGNAMRTANETAIFIEGTTVLDYNYTISGNTEYGEPIYYYFGNSSLIIENISDIGELIVINSTNITIRNVTMDKDGIIFGFVLNSTIENSNITSGKGTYLRESNYSRISNNTITTSGTNGYGVYLDMSDNSNISKNNITTSGGSGYGAVLYSSSNNTISSNTITTSGYMGIGTYLELSSSNTISNNNITTSGDGGYGAYLVSLSSSNTLYGNNILTTNTSAYGVYLYTSSSNNISGGSVVAKASYDYYWREAGMTNNVTATNFTATRHIYFYDTTSYFNYNNNSGSIWLKTNASTQTELTRTLVNWNNTLMKWNDTNSTAGITANYTITGMQATSIYLIYNTSAGVQKNQYNLTTDANGNLPPFKIKLNGNTEIKAVYYSAYVAPPAAPTCSDGTKNGDETGTDCGGSCSACSTDTGGGNIITNSIKVTPSNNPLTKVEITLKASKTNPAISVTKVSSVSVAAPAGYPYQYLEVSKNNFNDSDIETATIEFRVNLSWINANRITSIYLLRYAGGWDKLATNLTNSTESYNSYRAQTPGFSYFAIIGESTYIPQVPVQNTNQSSNNLPDSTMNTPNTNNAENSNTNSTGADPVQNKTSYDWIVILVASVVLFVAVTIYYIDHKRRKMNLQKTEINKQPQQKLIDPQMAAEYVNSRKKAFEDAETEYLVEKLKEMNRSPNIARVLSPPMQQKEFESQAHAESINSDLDDMQNRLVKLKKNIENR